MFRHWMCCAVTEDAYRVRVPLNEVDCVVGMVDQEIARDPRAQEVFAFRELSVRRDQAVEQVFILQPLEPCQRLAVSNEELECADIRYDRACVIGFIGASEGGASTIFAMRASWSRTPSFVKATHAASPSSIAPNGSGV